MLLLTSQQVNEMLELACRENKNFRDYTILRLLAGSGIRIGEACTLRIRDVDVENETIKVYPTIPTNAPGVRYVNGGAFAALKDYMASTFGNPELRHLDEERFLFGCATEANVPLSTRTVGRLVDELKTRCRTLTEEDRPMLTVNSFRHFFIMSQFRSGLSAEIVSVLLGHRSVEMTRAHYMMHEERYIADMESVNLAGISDRHLVLIGGGVGK